VLDRLFGLDSRRRRLLGRTRKGPLKDFLAVPFPSRDLPCQDAEYVALDLETTSLDPKRGLILSVGYVLIAGGCIRVESARHRIVRRIAPLPEQSVVIHGITDDMAAQGEDELEVLEDLLETLRGRVLLGHHARFDLRFLEMACDHHFAGRFICPVVDTLELAQRRLERAGKPPRPGELRLDALRRHYHLPRYRAHHALTDALGAAELFLAHWAHREGPKPLVLRDVLSRSRSRLS